MPMSIVLQACAPDRLLVDHEPLRVTAQDVHLWSFSLRGDVACVAACEAVLSADERRRAARFQRARDREPFVVAHGVQRGLLARYRGLQPQALCFGTGAAGKPFLLEPSGGQPAIAFNLSHSGDRALLAVTAGREVGVDLERLDPRIEPLAIGRRFFFGPEYEDITAAGAQHERFFRYWVAKEAVLKAQGVGLGFPLDGFQVRFTGGDRAVAESFDLSRLDGHWRLRIPDCEPGWFAAVCAAGEDWSVQFMP
jgi:4'-phosphopantetheinyl transferase